MTCQEFLSRHSDYLDGELGEVDAMRCRSHLAGCSACSRHDRIVQRSLTLLSDVPPIQPSTDFHDRLQHRLLHLQDEMARHDRFAGSGTLASLAIAGLIALVAWAPLMTPGRAGTGTATAIADAPAAGSPRAAGETLAAGGYTPVDLYGNPFGVPLLDGAPSLSAAFPGPYSPLIVEAPVTRASRRAARAVFAAYYPALE